MRSALRLPSSNLGTSTIRTDFINSMVDLRINEAKSNHLRWLLGTSTIRTDFINSMVTCAMKNLFWFAFFIGSARPPEMIQGSSVGRLDTKEIRTNASFVGSARQLLLKHNITWLERGMFEIPHASHQKFCKFESPKPYKHHCITNVHAEMEAHAIEQRCWME